MIKRLLPIAVALALLAGLLSRQAVQPSDFNEWKLKYGINYQLAAENSYREAIFRSNLEKIYKHNSDPTRTYNMGVNQFSALSQAEF